MTPLGNKNCELFLFFNLLYFSIIYILVKASASEIPSYTGSMVNPTE